MEAEVARYIKITVDTGFAGATHYDECELPDDWDSLTQGQQEIILNEACETAISNYIDAYAEVVGDDE